MTKTKNKKEIKKNEFRKNKDNKHPAYIYAKIGNELKFIGITHAPITDNVKNIKLEQNPNPADEADAYARPKSDKAKSNRFRKKEKGWRLSKKDKDKLKPYMK